MLSGLIDQSAELVRRVGGAQRAGDPMSDLLKVYGPIPAFIAVAFVVAHQFVDPAPPLRLDRA